MNNRCALLLPFLPLAAVPLAACGGPECQTNFDCGLYQQCTDDGVCVAGDRPDVGGGGGGFVGGGDGDDWSDEAIDWSGAGVEVSDAHFAGTIGNASIDADMTLWVNRLDGAVVLTMNSTVSPSFVILTVDDAHALEVPGTWTVDDVAGADIVSGYGQGCDDTDGHYDELLPPPVVTVPEPAAEEEARGDVVGPVVRVEFGDGEGTLLGDAPGRTRGVATFRYRVLPE